jgi:mannose/cellobiose epimerase-like protein (N-acyl-D-glucosamine 2-epimerase family)
MPSRRALLRIGTMAALAWDGAIHLQAAASPAEAAPAARPRPMNYLPPGKESYLTLAAEAEAVLRRDVLQVWFPRTVDMDNGGFRSDFARDWRPGPSGGKFSVFQGRMAWIAAQVAMRRPELRDQYLPYVRHGVQFLSDVLWDKEYGGFYWGLDDEGRISPSFTDGKHLYGIAFCMYGAAAAAQATKDPKALDLAERAFRWIEEHAHDGRNGGYTEWLTRTGTVVEPEADAGAGRKPSPNPFPSGFKSMNTHIHLLEAFAQLYEVWKDETLRSRLEELLTIIRDRVCVEPGVMSLYFTADWRAVPDHDSYGHDVEAGYLMLEAEEALGRPHDPRTERMARLLVDHALAHGWDETYGGFYRDGTTFGQPEDKQKEWWVQVEGLNALLLMHERHGREADVYFEAFQKQWQFIKDYQIDPEFHGLYEMVGPDGAPTNTVKGRIWKAAYHDGRALLNVTERLRRLAEARP